MNDYSKLIGKTIKAVQEIEDNDQVIELTFTDGSQAIMTGGASAGNGIIDLTHTEAPSDLPDVK